MCLCERSQTRTSTHAVGNTPTNKPCFEDSSEEGDYAYSSTTEESDYEDYSDSEEDFPMYREDVENSDDSDFEIDEPQQENTLGDYTAPVVGKTAEA